VASAFIQKDKTMLFSNLHSLLKRGVTINLVLAAVGDDKIEVTVLPSSEKSIAGTQLVAKTFVASPQELDEQFPAVMAGYASATQSLQEQLQALQKQTEEAASAAAEAAKASAKKPAPKSAPGASSKSSTPTKPNLMDDGEGDGEDVIGNIGGDNQDATASVAAQSDQADLISL
jgi:PRTRC genetic system protein E